MEFLCLYIMFDQKSQDIAVPDGVVKILLSQEKLTLSDCFLGIFRVDSSKRAKETCAQSGGEHSACQVKNRADFFFFFLLCYVFITAFLAELHFPRSMHLLIVQVTFSSLM